MLCLWKVSFLCSVGVKLNSRNELPIGQTFVLERNIGCVPLPEWTGMDIITGMDYRNGHYAMALGV